MYSNIKYSKFSLEQNNTSEKFFSIIMFLALFVVLAIQNTSAMNDVLSYKNLYESFEGWSFERFFNYWDKMKDPIYYFIGFLFKRMGASFLVWKICINAFYIFSTCKVVINYSSKPTLSIMAFVALGLYSFSFTGLRQVIAMSILMFSYRFMKEKKFVKFLLIVLLASAFHSTAVVFVVAYFIYHLKQNYTGVAVLLAGGIFIALNSRNLMSWYVEFADVNDAYLLYLESENSLSISGALIRFAILMFCFVFTFGPKWRARDSHLTGLLFVSVIFRILSATWFAELFRLSIYYSLFECLSIADACTTAVGEDRSIPRLKILGVSSVLLLYYLISI